MIKFNMLSTSLVASIVDAAAGIINNAFLTPLRLRSALNASGPAPVYACRAWVSFNGLGAGTINNSGNVSSVTYNGTGDYTVNFSTSMPDVDYAVNYSISPQFGARANWPHVNAAGASVTEEAPTVSSVRIGTLGSSKADTKYNYISIFR